MNGYQKINQDTKNAVERGTVPAHRTDDYNSQAAPPPPAASLFNKGATRRETWRRGNVGWNRSIEIALLDCDLLSLFFQTFRCFNIELLSSPRKSRRSSKRGLRFSRLCRYG
jgi:hypothetical protein